MQNYGYAENIKKLEEAGDEATHMPYSMQGFIGGWPVVSERGWVCLPPCNVSKKAFLFGVEHLGGGRRKWAFHSPLLNFHPPPPETFEIMYTAALNIM